MAWQHLSLGVYFIHSDIVDGTDKLQKVDISLNSRNQSKALDASNPLNGNFESSL